MTVETEVTRAIFAGNGVTTVFSYSFPIPGSSATDQTNAELVLLGTDSSITVLADNLWSITGVDTGVGGTTTYNPGSPITTGAFLVLTRIVPYEQTTTLSGQGAYSPAVVEAALDNLAFQTEQLNTWRLQSIRAPITDAALADLPTKAFRAGAFLKFDSNGDPSTASSTTGLAGSILVGTTTTASSLTTDLLITGSSVASVVTVSGITTATINGGTPALTNTHIFVGNGSNVATDVAMSGDATMANTGAITLGTVNSNVGSFTNATVTVDGKGRVTAAASGSISGGSTLYHTTGDPAVDVVSTSSETTLITYSLPGGTLSTGGILMAVLRGDLLNNQSGVACTYTFRVKYGGTTLCSFALANGTGPGSPGPPAFWRLDFTLAARGSASKQYFNGRITQNDGAAAEGASSSVAIDAMGENNASAEASAGALNIVVTVQMNQNNALNETRLYSASITQVA